MPKDTREMSVFVDQLQTDVQSKLKEIASTSDRIKRNNLKREAHYKNELFIMDLEEKLEEAGGLENAAPHLKTLLEECYAIRDKQLPLEGLGKPSLAEKVWSVFRLIAFVLWFFLAMVTFFVLTPLRWLHPLLRRVGVPNNYLPLDFMQWFYAAGLLAVAGVHCRAEGVEQFRALKGSSVVFFSHGSNCDPLILLSKSPVIPKLVGKLSLFMIPVVGWAARWSFGALPIDRGNRAKAIKSLQRAQTAVQTWGRSIGISPEGTRSKTGQLLPFKKGPFHLQEDTGVPITPALVFGAYELWPRNRFFTGTGKAVIRFLPSYLPDAKRSRNDNIKDCRKLFLKGLAEQLPDDASAPLDAVARVLNVLAVLAVYFYAYSLVHFTVAASASLMEYLQWTLGQLLAAGTLSGIALSALMMFLG